MKFPITRTVITTSSIVIYLKKRKLYVDDKVYRIRILPKKTIKIYQKDVVNIIGIVGTSTLCIVIAEKAYFLAKNKIAKYDISFDFKISKRLPSADTIDTDITSVDVSDVTSISNTDVLKSKNKFPIRDIVWIAVAIGLTYYLGQRIDGTGFNDVNIKEFNKQPKIPTLTTNLSWWDKLTMPDWMIKDLSDEGTYGQVTRPTIITDNIEPIANKKPRRIVVILFTILQQIPSPKGNSKIPTWVYSPVYYVAQIVYRKFNK